MLISQGIKLSSRRCFKIVRDSDAADFWTVRVTLFRCETGICAWYISSADKMSLPDTYLPRSKKLMASVAVCRALAVADQMDAEICIIDPDGLWPEAWSGC